MSNALHETHRLRADLRACYEAAVRGVQPAELMARFDLEDHLDRSLDTYRRIAVVGTGKAAMAMAGVLEQHLQDVRPTEGLVVVPHGYAATLPDDVPSPQHVDVVEGGHPVPDVDGVAAAERDLEIAAGCGEDDVLIVLISGGGSALWPALVDGITLDDAQAVARLLLNSGADIHAINTVRKHLSRIKGGQLARAARPAAVLALVLSDVIGDDLSVIASGPTVPDPSTFADAARVLREHGLWEEVPRSVRQHLQRGLDGTAAETPGAGDAAFRRARTVLFGSNRDALAAAQAEAERRGYHVAHVEGEVSGEARDVGRRQAEELRAVGRDVQQPTCLLWGGETTVTVRGDGRGGRNQELALAAALALDGSDLPTALLSGGTDGIDGPTDAAGAVVTPRTVGQARRAGLDDASHLQNNDAYPFFARLNCLLQPGPTHTNVMDVQIALVLPEDVSRGTRH